MRIYKRGKIYWYEFEFNGTQYRRSSKSGNRRVAETVMTAFHNALAKGDVGIIQRKKAPTFSVAKKAFLDWSELEHQKHASTTERYRYSLMPLAAHFRDRLLDDITPYDAEDYKKHRSKQKNKAGEKLRPATVNRELACLRAMFNHAMKEHPQLRNPISKSSGVRLLEEDNMQDRVLDFVEEQAYLNAASSRLCDVATLILEQGMRPGEVFQLRDTAVLLDRAYLRILEGKTKAARRRIELTSVSIELLRRRLGEMAERKVKGYLFPCETDADRPMPGLQSAHGAALALSKVARFRLYDLRHTFATRAVEGGMDLVTLAATLGHSRLQMVLRYAHPRQEHHADAMDKVQKYKAAQRAKELASRDAAEAVRPALHIVPKAG